MLKEKILAVDNNDFGPAITINSQLTLSRDTNYRWGSVLQLQLSFSQIQIDQWENTPALNAQFIQNYHNT